MPFLFIVCFIISSFLVPPFNYYGITFYLNDEYIVLTTLLYIIYMKDFYLFISSVNLNKITTHFEKIKRIKNL